MEQKTKLSEIKPNKDNPRQISADALEKLKASINRDPAFMTLRPIVVDENGVILGGNMRYRACVALGMTEVPADWIVKAADLTQEQKQRFILVDNAPAGMSGEWDYDSLANLWNVSDLVSLGFEPGELGLGDLGEPLSPEFGSDGDVSETTTYSVAINTQSAAAFEAYCDQNPRVVKKYEKNR